MDESPWGWWIAAATGVLIASTWVGARMGQALAADEMEELWGLFEGGLEAAVSA